MSKSLRDIS